VVESALAKASVAHNPESITSVVIQPKTGEILAMANLPDFDPNAYGNFDAESRKNRAVTNFFEPGSMFKIVAISGALEFGTVTAQTIYDCENGSWSPPDSRLLRDSHGYGLLTVEDILIHSSNIGTAKVALDLGKENLFYFVKRFGFGSRPSVSLRGVTRGYVRSLSDWTTLSMTRIPMGHEIAVSALQMGMAMAAIANDGKRMKPQLVHSVRSPAGRVLWQFTPKVIDQPIGPDTAAIMKRALTGVVERGTARRAQLDGYRSAGKTGTAQYAENGVYPPGLWTSSFVGFCPAEDPAIVVIVVVDRPQGDYYGGTVAAPVFKEITGKVLDYYQIPRREPIAQDSGYAASYVGMD
jgi:cell division protein FtsI/penicillin-binding protein 2